MYCDHTLLDGEGNCRKERGSKKVRHWYVANEVQNLDFR